MKPGINPATDETATEMTTAKHRIFTTEFAKVYPLYVKKAERKGRSRDEVDELAKGKAMEKILR